MRTTVVVFVGIVVSGAATARADIVDHCGQPGWAELDVMVAARDLFTRIAASDIPDSAKADLAVVWQDVLERNGRLRASKLAFDDACGSALAHAVAVRAQNAAYEAHCFGSDPPDSCAGEEAAVRAAYAAAEAEGQALIPLVETNRARLESLDVPLDTYLRDGEAALLRWFTGKKVVRLTAKSWIDGQEITELTVKAGKLLFEADNVPLSPDVKDDFRLYQTFVVEVIFKQGKIKKAFFVKHSPQHLAGVTEVPLPVSAMPFGVYLLRVGFTGRIYVRDQRVQISADRRSVVFTRKVEGSPSLWVLSLDKLADTGQDLLSVLPLPIDDTVLGSLGKLPTIWNSLRVEITAQDTRPSGDGSAFPSHRFWLGDVELDRRGQVQPSSYFGDD